MTTWRLDYECAVQRQGSITLDVIRTIFIGPSANGKSTLKHLLVHDESVDITRSTPVLETPAIVSLSSEQFAAKEASSSWKVVSDESMAACIRIACRRRDYQAVPLNPITRLVEGARILVKHRGNEKKSGNKSKKARNPVVHPHSQPVPPEQEVLQPSLAMKQAHKALLDNLGTGVEDQLLHTARFVHLLDSGGQPPFQDALPLLLQVPCTYVLVFDASRDLDKPLYITYRCEGATEEEHANLETVWEMLLRLLSSVHTLAQKCSRSMANFQEKGGHLPQIRILLIGTFKDRLIREGRLQEAIEELNKRIKSLEKKPYYKHIARDSNDRPFFLINNRMYLDAVGNAKEEKACLSDLRRLLSDPSASLKLQVPLGWFQFELVTRQVKEKFFKVSELQKSALKLKCVTHAKEFRSLLTLFHFLGFFTYYEQDGISDIVCTDNNVFLKEVSKLLAVQYLHAPKTQAVQAFKEKGILTLDEHLADELSLSKELDRPWLLRVLCHLGLTACYAQSGAGLPKYFFPAALRSQGTQELAAGSVEPLLVAFVFKDDVFDATHDMPRGIFCYLAVELAVNRGWTVIPEQSTRLAIKFRWKGLVVIIEESVGFIRVIPIVSSHADCNPDELHDRCHAVISTIKEAVEESAQAVFGDQFTDRANVDLGFLCPCAIQSPHLAVPGDGSIVCQMSQTDQRLLQAHRVWFSQVQGAEVSVSFCSNGPALCISNGNTGICNMYIVYAHVSEVFIFICTRIYIVAQEHLLLIAVVYM